MFINDRKDKHFYFYTVMSKAIIYTSGNIFNLSIIQLYYQPMYIKLNKYVI